MLQFLAGEGFSACMAKLAPGSSPTGDDYSSAQEFRMRHLIAMLRREDM